jgi:spore maturation protein CgeB
LKVLYIGQYSDGTTSKMRADTLIQILQPSLFEVIDTHVPFYKSHPFWRSLAFRFKKGKVIWETNSYIEKQLSGKYDLIWVDKAVFISEKVTKRLRKQTKLLVHYTPDTAFEENASKHFYKSIGYYDFVITTKSFEKEAYLKYIPKEKLLFTPQGFNPKLHYPRHAVDEKVKRVIFIGLFESAREELLSALLKENIPVALAGKNWKAFVKDHKDFPLTYLGDGLFSEAYANSISESAIGLGLVSKRFPELHTTRTFEIPACGTLLVTERNKETSNFFKEDEVIFYSSMGELVSKIKFYLNQEEELKKMTKKAVKRVNEFGFDYQSQLKKVLELVLKEN